MKVFGGIFGFGVLLMGLPIGLAAAGIDLPTAVYFILMGFGFILSVIGGAAIAVSNFYVKSSPNVAYVKDGMGGTQVIYKGGGFVVKAVHSLVEVPLGTIQLVVSRRGGDALITSNNLRADITAEFFIKVPPNEDAIKNAATSLGDVIHDESALRDLIEKKLVSALRTVAAKTELQELHSNRDTFMKGVIEIVEEDLKKNGLMLESATISHLDQTPVEALNKNNVFDAQGAATIAEITEAQLTSKNDREREGQELRRQRDVAAAKRLLELDQEREEADAAQKAAIASKKSAEERRAEEARIAKVRAVQVAEIERQQAEEVAEQRRQKAVEVEGEQRRQAQEVAQQEASKAKEVAEQARIREVAEAQQAAAEAEAARQEAEALAEAARQKVRTVEVTETAKRDKEQQVIAAEAKAEQDLVTAQKAADADAYKVEKHAAARKQAADADAEAITKKAEAEAAATRARAEADRDAAVAQAAGEKANQMIPVDVKRAEVEVEAERVDVQRRHVDEVVRPELEAREKSGRVAQEFELDKARIEMEGKVGVAFAAAMGDGLSKAELQLFGTPDDAARMMSSLVNGMRAGKYADGVMETMPPEVIAAAGAMGASGLALLGQVAKRFGIKMPETPAITDSKKETGEQPGA